VSTLRYLLDTNALSDLVRHPAGPVARRIAAVGEEAVCTSVIVACELRYGAAKKQSPALTERIDALLGRVTALPLEADADAHYAKIRAHLQRAGQPIGPNDLLIAAHALALGLTVVTDNVGEFSRVPGLAVENWAISE
jgi:Predicted nucleic acid-binding protein, contains PIN domain